jgi:hypothetical protein
MNRALTIALAVLLAACANDPRPNTPSRNLEVTLTGVGPACARAAMERALTTHGYPVESTDSGRLIAGRLRRADGREERLSVQFLPRPGGALQVVIYANLVTNPGTAFERLQPIRPTQFQQDQFDRAKQDIERTCAARR